jgi:exopolysaccharide production protein ExoY
LSHDSFVYLDDRAIASRQGEAAHYGKRSYFIIKRGMDVAAASCLLLALSPLLLVLMALIYRDGGHPLYSQPRLGRSAKTFTLWKLRTMVMDADKALADHLASNEEARTEWSETQKLRHDPRVTAIGRFLRKYSIDELPQLWNVLVGDMSLVGPRPMFLEQRAMYLGIPYCDLRPGLTGLWQVSDRNNCAFADRAGWDTRYAQMLSLWTDLRILLMTIVVVFRGTGC